MRKWWENNLGCVFDFVLCFVGMEGEVLFYSISITPVLSCPLYHTLVNSKDLTLFISGVKI